MFFNSDTVVGINEKSVTSGALETIEESFYIICIKGLFVEFG